MKCVLHIGTEKTGTTLIQEWLYENQKELSNQRIYLSEILGKANNRIFVGYFQSIPDDWTMENGINTAEDKARFFDGFSERLSREIKAASINHDVFVITSEHLHSRLRKRDELERMKAFLDDNFEETLIVCYFRNQADMAVSLYTTALQVGFTQTLDSFLSNDVGPDNYYYNFKAIADNWSSVFGKNSCVFKIYDRSSFVEGDLRIDFLQTLPCDLDTTKLSYATDSRNESVGRLTAVAFRKINEHVRYGKGPENARLNIELKSLMLALESLKFGRLDSERKRDIASLFEDANAEFLDAYFSQRDRLAPNFKDYKYEKTFSYEEVENVIADILSVLLPYIGDDAIRRLCDSDADYLRDIAISIEQGKPLTLEDLNALMRLALRARPSGAFIRKKVEEYATRLNKLK